MDKKSFIEKYLPYAQQVEKKYGVPASVTLAQAAIESKWGASGLTQKANAFFGIKTTKSWTGDIYTAGTKEEDKNGNKYNTVAAFRKYSSPLESFLDYGNFLTTNKRYSEAFKAKDSYAFGAAIAKAGYATDSSYTKLLTDIMKQNNLTKYDGTYKTGDFNVQIPDSMLNNGGTVTEDVFGHDTDTGDEAYDREGALNPGATLPNELSEKFNEGVGNLVSGTLKTGTKILLIILVILIIVGAIFLAIKTGGGSANA